ncbi:12794_t:CDS:2 [Funneliformis geosporum]|nr:12794_t:CDS:2 [Funneliformis geosporum]
MESNKKQSTNDISNDSKTLCKAFEKNLEDLENLVKLFKNDIKD